MAIVRQEHGHRSLVGESRFTRLARSLFSNRSRKRRNRSHHRRLVAESLEDRCLLTVVSLTPVNDNSLIAYSASSNPPYSGGADPDLYLGIEHYTGTVMRALMEFDVAGNVPAGATINSATLTGWVSLTYPGTPGTLNVQLHKTLADWGEGTSNGTGRMPGIPWDRATTGDATWLQTLYNSNTALNKWATPGGDFSPTVSGVTGFGADGTSATWSSTAQMVADVQGWLNDPTTNFGWVLKSDEIQDVGIYIDSSEATNLAHRPTLTIDYTVAAPPPTLAIAATSASKAEGNSGSTPFTFTVTRSGDTSGTSSVNYAVTGSGANAANGTDFTGGALPNGGVNFAAGATSQTITVNVNGDTTVEPDEGFTVTLSGPVGAAITTASAAGTITNDDSTSLPTLAIAATSASKAEGNSGSTPFTFTVTRSGDTSGTSSVNYAVTGSGANAANGTDFTGGALPNGGVNFAAGATSQTITVNVNGDTTVEPDEGFTVTLSGPVGATITTASAAGTITNDDSTSLPTLAIAATSASKTEGNSGSTPFTFTVTRSGDASGTSSVDYAVTGSGANAANGTDFTGGALPNGSVNFAAGATSQTITVNVNGDTTVEPNEGFTVTLSGPVGATITTASAAGTITNDDSTSLPTLAIAATSASKAEGNSGSTPFTFTVTRSGNTSGISSVNYAVTGSGANAANGTDFTGGALPSGSVNFAAGATSQTITVNVNGDTTVEPDEGFTVTLSGPVGATITTASAAGTITNDDASGSATLSIDDVTLQEGDDGTTDFVFTVTLNGTTDGPVTVDFATADGTAMANGTQGSGADSHEADSHEADDHEADDHEADDHEADDHEADDHEADDHEADDHEADDREHGDGEDGEGEDREDDGPSNHAGVDGDYTAESGSLHFAGKTGETLIITVPVHGAKDVEPDETFYVNLSNAAGAEIADGQGMGTITNDDLHATDRKCWQNPRDQFDVDDKDGVTALDVLTMISYINAQPNTVALPTSIELKPPFFDVSGDDMLTAMDVLMVINHINGRGRNAGEGEAMTPASDASPSEPRDTDDSEPRSMARLAMPPIDQENLSARQATSREMPPPFSARPAFDEAHREATDETKDHSTRRVGRSMEDVFDREMDFAGLEEVLSDIGGDIHQAWQRF